MNHRIIFKTLNLCLLALMVKSCGKEKTDLRKPPLQDSDLIGKASAVIVVNLPKIDVLTNSNTENFILPNTAFIAAIPSDENCAQDADWETLLSYPEQLEVIIPTKGGCDYKIDVRLGFIGNVSPLPTAVTFDDPIKALLVENCASCHDGFDIYETVALQADAIVSQISSKLMPPPSEGALTEEAIAKFLAWQSDGYPEKSQPAKEDEGSLAARLSEVYYRNKANVEISASYLAGREKHVYLDLLWRQEAGMGRGYDKASIGLEKSIIEQN